MRWAHPDRAPCWLRTRPWPGICPPWSPALQICWLGFPALGQTRPRAVGKKSRLLIDVHCKSWHYASCPWGMDMLRPGKQMTTVDSPHPPPVARSLLEAPSPRDRDSEEWEGRQQMSAPLSQARASLWRGKTVPPLGRYRSGSPTKTS